VSGLSAGVQRISVVMPEVIVVVGAGQAAAQLAVSLRQGGFRGSLRIVGDESYLPYQRPPLSKKFLAEPARLDSLLLRPASLWQDQAVAIELGTAVATLDLPRSRVVLRDGRHFDYGTLVLATGTRARTLPLPGIELPGVFSVRRIDDVRALRPALDAARRVVIIGGGYIGLEVAAVMRGEGRDVTVIEAEDRVMKRVTGAIISSFFERLHRDRGVDVRLRARLGAIDGEQRATGVRLADGTMLPADLVLVATGARANDDLAAAAGLACDDGILVDEFARTGATNVYAVGDCARFPSRRFGRTLRLECVQNAIDQAKAAAAAILGQPAAYDPVPWFWSDQYEIKLQMAGLMDDHDSTAQIGDPDSGRFSVDYRRNGRLIAVDAVNDGRAHMLGRRRIAEETAGAPVG
jgi:3-phenylpropionate/trans-cinnamate dioxygenase ferredoxin reductase component